MEFGFCKFVEFNTQRNQYVFVVVKHFSKWLELVPLPNYSSGGTTYAFLDRKFNQFGIPTKTFTTQGTKFYGEFQELCE
jgi:hypothetical protein